MTTLRQRLAADDGFAMIYALFLVVVLAATSVAAFGLTTSQTKPTTYEQKYIRTGDAASSGLQAAIGQIRTSVSANQGDLTKLPCIDPTDAGGVPISVGSGTPQIVTVPGDQISGPVATNGQPGATESFTASIVYYQADPTANESNPSLMKSNALSCVNGLVDSVPGYAFIQSVGSGTSLPGFAATSGNRVEHAVYDFADVATNVTGGRLSEFSNGNQFQMCLDAGGINPTAGTQPKLMPCQAIGFAQQTWQYRNDLSIFYGGNPALNLCIQSVNSIPELEPCIGDGTSATQTYPYNPSTLQTQEWAFNDNGHLQAPDTSDGGVGSGPCLEGNGSSETQPASAGALLVLQGCTGSTTGYLAWNPDPQFGAGKAGGNTSGVPGPPTGQYVNYALFGNCLDVSGEAFANGLIAYPCKQAPDSSTLTWNQIWNYQSVSGSYGILYTVCAAGASGCVPASPSAPVKDCLTAPASGNLVAGVTCPASGSTVPDSELWQATGNTGTYSTSYLLVNKATGACMAPNPSTTNSTTYAQIVLTSCDGSGVPSSGSVKNPLLLKWNAPPNPPNAGLTNIQAEGGSVNYGS